MKRDDVLAIRDGVYASLLVREGIALDASVCMERANNITQWLEATIDDLINAALKEAARGSVVAGSIDAEVFAHTPPGRVVEDGAVPMETMEEHAGRIIK